MVTVWREHMLDPDSGVPESNGDLEVLDQFDDCGAMEEEQGFEEEDPWGDGPCDIRGSDVGSNLKCKRDCTKPDTLQPTVPIGAKCSPVIVASPPDVKTSWEDWKAAVCDVRSTFPFALTPPKCEHDASFTFGVWDKVAQLAGRHVTVFDRRGIKRRALVKHSAIEAFTWWFGQLKWSTSADSVQDATEKYLRQISFFELVILFFLKTGQTPGHLDLPLENQAELMASFITGVIKCAVFHLMVVPLSSVTL